MRCSYKSIGRQQRRSEECSVKERSVANGTNLETTDGDLLQKYNNVSSADKSSKEPAKANGARHKGRQTTSNLRKSFVRSTLELPVMHNRRKDRDSHRQRLEKGKIPNQDILRRVCLSSRKFKGTQELKLEERNVRRKDKSKKYTCGRQSGKFDQFKDSRSKLSNEHKHIYRVRSRSVSPTTYKRHTSPKKRDPNKPTSPRRSLRLEWEKFERDRGNMLASFDSRYRRFGGGTSGLGGYSPRRRRSEAAIKTPSPPPRSPERRKPRAWDLPPPGMDNSVVAAISAAHQAVAQQVAAQQAAAALVSVAPLVPVNALTSPVTTSAAASSGLTAVPALIPSLLQQINPAVTAVTLTQATRPLRRLYVGNVPSTVSDGELLEFMNAAMLSANANHLLGTKPCINCLVNVEKSYAFAEFITPEDATAALAFDGVTLHGTILKIRRPKDFVLPASGGAENASPILDMVSSNVADSPNKVFVGGIASPLTLDKVKEIVTAFGQLKAYHWEVDTKKQPPQAYAFLEYMDPSVTLKACAGLNGMRLGAGFLTVVQATPNACLLNSGSPFYGIPEHVKTLLEPPTRILELQNLLTAEELLTMSKREIEEISDDVHHECMRFGNVKSMHIVRPSTKEYFAGDIFEEASKVECASQELLVGCLDDGDLFHDVDMDPARNKDCGPQMEVDAEASMICGVDVVEGIGGDERVSNEGSQLTKLRDALKIVSEKAHTKMMQDVATCQKDAPAGVNSDFDCHCVRGEIEVLEPHWEGLHMGRVYVEYSREESACQAAHSLHGRRFGNRKVVACFFPLRLYQKRFNKGLGARTYEEKQALALAVQGHLTAHIKD